MRARWLKEEGRDHPGELLDKLVTVTENARIRLAVRGRERFGRHEGEGQGGGRHEGEGSMRGRAGHYICQCIHSPHRRGGLEEKGGGGVADSAPHSPPIFTLSRTSSRSWSCRRCWWRWTLGSPTSAQFVTHNCPPHAIVHTSSHTLTGAGAAGHAGGAGRSQRFIAAQRGAG